MWILSLSDLIFTPLLIIVYWAYYKTVYSRLTDPVEKKIFSWAIKVKLLGLVLFIFLIEFYFQGGDTAGYYSIIKQMQYAGSHSGELMSMIKNTIMDANSDLAKEMYDPEDAKNYYTMLKPDIYFFCKVSYIISLFSIKSYFWIAGILSLYAFSGTWAIFKVFSKSFDVDKWLIAFPILFIPSVVFWSSGVLKDTLAFGAMGFSFYYLHKVFFKFEIKMSVVLFLFLNIYISFNVKSYIAACLVAAMLIAVIVNLILKQKSFFKKVITFLIVLVITIIGIVEGVSYYTSQDKLDEIAINNISTIAEYQKDIYQTVGGGSYITPIIPGDAIPILMISGIINTLMRPFIWEISNPMMILTALESMVFIWLGAIVFFKRKWVKSLTTYPLLMFTFIFSIMLSIIIGVTTFNFGAIVRYKIPLLPFIFVFLILVKNIKTNK